MPQYTAQQIVDILVQTADRVKADTSHIGGIKKALQKMKMRKAKDQGGSLKQAKHELSQLGYTNEVINELVDVWQKAVADQCIKIGEEKTKEAGMADLRLSKTEKAHAGMKTASINGEDIKDLLISRARASFTATLEGVSMKKPYLLNPEITPH